MEIVPLKKLFYTRKKKHENMKTRKPQNPQKLMQNPKTRAKNTVYNSP